MRTVESSSQRALVRPESARQAAPRRPREGEKANGNAHWRRYTARLEVDAGVRKLGLEGEAAPDLDDKVGRVLVEDLQGMTRASVSFELPAREQARERRRRRTGSSSSRSSCALLWSRRYSRTTLSSSGSSAPR